VRGAIAIAAALPLGLLLVAGCHGNMRISGPIWIFDGDDDDSGAPDDDDSSADDDDLTPPDDDDATPGGPVVCGPTVAPGDGWDVAAHVFTGSADIELEYDERGGLFAAVWSGCEAKHFYDATGEYLCGIRWEAVGDSYGEQVQTTQLVSRFAMEFTLAESTCGLAHPEAEDRSLFFRITVSSDGGATIPITWSPDVNTLPDDMFDWAVADWKESEPFPDLLELLYFTAFEASGR